MASDGKKWQIKSLAGYEPEQPTSAQGGKGLEQPTSVKGILQLTEYVYRRELNISQSKLHKINSSVHEIHTHMDHTMFTSLLQWDSEDKQAAQCALQKTLGQIDLYKLLLDRV